MVNASGSGETALKQIPKKLYKPGSPFLGSTKIGNYSLKPILSPLLNG